MSAAIAASMLPQNPHLLRFIAPLLPIKNIIYFNFETEALFLSTLLQAAAPWEMILCARSPSMILHSHQFCVECL